MRYFLFRVRRGRSTPWGVIGVQQLVDVRKKTRNGATRLEDDYELTMTKEFSSPFCSPTVLLGLQTINLQFFLLL